MTTNAWRWFIVGAMGALMFGAVARWMTAEETLRRRIHPGWGIDACLTRHVRADQFASYLPLLRRSAVGVLRERDVGFFNGTSWNGDVRESFATLAKSGYKIVAFAHLPFPHAAPMPGNVLVEDLQHVFEQGIKLGSRIGKNVMAFEMVGEPDLAYCRDLPDRVVAYQKALYLGIKKGANERGDTRPWGVMGALGFPASPWVERAAKNGLLDYTDSYNFHFYGHAEQFTGVLESHRALLAELRGQGYAPQEALPFWITECGLDAVRKDDFLNGERRRLHSDFTIDTARQALAAADVALFMPFILVQHENPYALTISARRPLPAWDAYAEFTSTHPWPARPLVRAAHSPHPVVVQWLPNNATTLPLKVGGTYRFRARGSINGVVRIYNFSDQPVSGTLATSGMQHFRVEGLIDVIKISAFGVFELPVTLYRSTDARFRDDWELTYRDGRGPSRALIGIESHWAESQFRETALAVRPLSGGRTAFPQGRYIPGDSVGPWETMNGLVGRSVAHDSWEFSASQVTGDPLYPTMAVAQVNGLPSDGLLRVRFDRKLHDSKKMRVILVDKDGRRFTIWENCGVDYYDPQDEMRLDVRDFHPYAWGKVDGRFRMDPAAIREVQLRFYFAKANDPLGLRLSWLMPQPSASAAVRTN